MEKHKIVKSLQIFICSLCWLTFSPLFYYLAGKFKLLAKRWKVILLLLSPLMLCTYFVLYIIGCFGTYFIYDRYLVKYRFSDNERIERISGVSFPELEIQNYYRGGRSFTGDYSDRLVLKFAEKPSDELNSQLDSLARYHHGWKKEHGWYLYSMMWGNGDDAPKGENGNEQLFIFIAYKSGSDSLTVDYGSW